MLPTWSYVGFADDVESPASMDIDYPALQNVPPHRLWALFWAAVFFFLINLLVWAVFRSADTKPFLRLQLKPSYAEIVMITERIRRDPRPKIVFLGTSVIAGATAADPLDTVPAVYAELLSKEAGHEVPVYNLGISGARPLDAYLLALILRDSTTLFIIDNNRQNSSVVSKQHLESGMSAYVRISQLYRDHATDLYRDIPATKECFIAYNIPLIDNVSFGNQGLLSYLSAYVPLLKYKDLTNIRLFGQHPIGVAEEALLALHSGNPLKELSMLFAPAEQKINDTPWTPAASQTPYVSEPAFDPNDINNCLIRAFSKYVVAAKLPVVEYLSPNNPGIVHQSTNAMHRENNAMILSLFDGTHVLDFDDGSIPYGLFTDLQHFTVAGSHAFATLLFKSTHQDLVRSGFLR